MSPQGFKARVGSLIFTWQRRTKIHLWCYTSRPHGGQHGGQSGFYNIASRGERWPVQTHDLLCVGRPELSGPAGYWGLQVWHWR